MNKEEKQQWIKDYVEQLVRDVIRESNNAVSALADSRNGIQAVKEAQERLDREIEEAIEKLVEISEK